MDMLDGQSTGGRGSVCGSRAQSCCQSCCPVVLRRRWGSSNRYMTCSGGDACRPGGRRVEEGDEVEEGGERGQGLARQSPVTRDSPPHNRACSSPQARQQQDSVCV